MSPRANKMRDLEFYVKHSFSCLSDQKFRVLIDDERMIVTVISTAFDSTLTGWLVTRILPDDHEVVAFTDDNSAWNPNGPAYSLRIRIGGDNGQEFDAEAVRLASAVWGNREIAITLTPTTTRDLDVTECCRRPKTDPWVNIQAAPTDPRLAGLRALDDAIRHCDNL